MEPEDNGQGGQQDNSQGQEGTGINPAWNELLSSVPEDLHSQVTPHLQNWDKGVQERFNKVHEEYAGYKPFIESGITPGDLQFGLGLVEAIQNEPEKVMKALQDWMEVEGNPAGGGDSQGQINNQPQGQENGQPQTPAEYQRLEAQMNQMAQYLLNQQQQTQEQAEQAKISNEIDAAKKKYPDLDEQYVISQMLYRELSAEDAAKEWQEKIEGRLAQTKRAPVPPILGAGGTFPDSQGRLDPTKLNSKDTKSAVAQALIAAAQQE